MPQSLAETDFEPAEVNDEVLFQPIEKTTRHFHITVAVLLAFTFLMLIAYITQLRQGLGVTGLTIPTYWGSISQTLSFSSGSAMRAR